MKFLQSLFLLLACISFANASINFEGKKSKWYDFERTNLTGVERTALVVSPKVPRADKAWILRPAFFGAFPKADIAALEKGFYVAYFDVTHFYANHESRKLMDKFYELMTTKYGLNKKVALEGLSRGGAFSLTWANDDPSKIACVYVDNPVCDFREWPRRHLKGEEKLCEDFRKIWNLTKKNEKNFNQNPFDNLEKLAKSGTPVLMIVGDSDTTVPFEKHGKIYQKRFFDNGGNFRLIVRKGGKHHPHGLDNPKEIIDFFEAAYDSQNALDRTSAEYKKFNKIENRDGIKNAFKTFADKKHGTVAFVGGSITEMKGWKDIIATRLQERFPETKFTFIKSGISSLGTSPHAFRLSSDIPNLKDVDLLFIEGAVNDDTNIAFTKAGDFSMEGVVRQALKANPKMDIIMLHFIYDNFLKEYANNGGNTPKMIIAHESVAKHYNLPSINLSDEIYARMSAGQFDWKRFGGTHPAPFGHAFYARAIENMFDMNLDTRETNVKKLPKLLCKNALEYAHFEPVENVKIKSGWTVEKNWKAKTKVGVRGRFKNLSMLETRQAGAEFEFAFEGSAVGAYILSGDEAGILEYSVDGAPFKSIDTFTIYSRSLYLPLVILFEDNLPRTKHKIVVRMSSRKNPKSAGNACQIIKFCVN